MSKHDLQNENLDRIGRKLLSATKASDEEIEKIVSMPRLFDSVKARIKAEEVSRQKSKHFFGDWASVFVWNRQAAGAFAILVVALTCASAIIFKNQATPELAKQISESESQPQIQRQIALTENQPPVSETEEIKNLPVKTLPMKNRVAAERAVFKIKKPKTPIRERKLNPVKQPQDAEKQAQEVFYSLSVDGSWKANDEDLRIVRAELSKAELFALGVNLPVEIDAVKVKTDLLVSADGVARAIKFVE